MPTKRKPAPMGRPTKYTGKEKLRSVKVPLTESEFERIKTTTDPRQRAAVLLKLCDDIDAVVKG